jgi:hypothetical protein
MKKIIIPLLLVVLGLICRLLPHPANFAPIGAIALFGGLYLPKRWAIILPLVAMFVSDIFIGFYTWQIMVSVYGSFILAGLIGLWARTHKTFFNIVSSSILISISFYLFTNAAVCFFGTMYTHNFSGLMQSYFMAIPFFRNSLLGDLFYTGILVGGFELVRRVILSERSESKDPFSVN